MQISEKLLNILVCPETHLPVSLAPADLIDRLNEKIDQKQLLTSSKSPVIEKLTAGLLREDRKVLYPIRDGIPVMLVDEAIHL